MKARTMVLAIASVIMLLGGGFLILQYGSCTDKGTDGFNLTGNDIYRYEIYAESGDTVTIHWKVDDGVWAWYTDPSGEAFPSMHYCFGDSIAWVSGVAELGRVYEDKPALEISRPDGEFLYYLPMTASNERTTVIEAEQDGKYCLCFQLAFYPDSTSANVTLEYSIEKPFK